MNAKLFQDDSGNFSMGRLTQFMIVVAVLANWVLVSFKTGAVVSLGWEEVSLLIGAQGAKALQKFAEPNVPFATEEKEKTTT